MFDNNPSALGKEQPMRLSPSIRQGTFEEVVYLFCHFRPVLHRIHVVQNKCYVGTGAGSGKDSSEIPGAIRRLVVIRQWFPRLLPQTESYVVEQ